MSHIIFIKLGQVKYWRLQMCLQEMNRCVYKLQDTKFSWLTTFNVHSQTLLVFLYFIVNKNIEDMQMLKKISWNIHRTHPLLLCARPWTFCSSTRTFLFLTTSSRVVLKHGMTHRKCTKTKIYSSHVHMLIASISIFQRKFLHSDQNHLSIWHD